jgi:hypothetical protein
MDTIRLACEECDTKEGDGLTLATAVRRGWTHIQPVVGAQEQSEWWDHLGFCPEHCPDTGAER